MSVAAYACEECKIEGVFDRAGKFPEDGDEATYGVAWRCPKCEAVSLDLCPMGPVEPTPGSCLNCGGDVVEDKPCAACGMPRSEALEFLRVDDGPRTVDDAAAAFSAGRYRHAFAILDVLLQRDAANAGAWAAKGDGFRGLRLAHAAVRCFRRARSLGQDEHADQGMVLALLATARDFNEREDAEPGLRAADEALGISRNHPRALYQRAWALGMLGRVDEAIVSLTKLLTIEPDNEDAKSALEKMESALLAAARGNKPWWKLW
jgi:tetratricopeptide (TPR) repeat protein